MLLQYRFYDHHDAKYLTRIHSPDTPKPDLDGWKGMKPAASYLIVKDKGSFLGTATFFGRACTGRPLR